MVCSSYIPATKPGFKPKSHARSHLVILRTKRVSKRKERTSQSRRFRAINFQYTIMLKPISFIERFSSLLFADKKRFIFLGIAILSSFIRTYLTQFQRIKEKKKLRNLKVLHVKNKHQNNGENEQELLGRGENLFGEVRKLSIFENVEVTPDFVRSEPFIENYASESLRTLNHLKLLKKQERRLREESASFQRCFSFGRLGVRAVIDKKGSHQKKAFLEQYLRYRRKKSSNKASGDKRKTRAEEQLEADCFNINDSFSSKTETKATSTDKINLLEFDLSKMDLDSYCEPIEEPCKLKRYKYERLLKGHAEVSQTKRSIGNFINFLQNSRI